jgi:hypothetical protein
MERRAASPGALLGADFRAGLTPSCQYLGADSRPQHGALPMRTLQAQRLKKRTEFEYKHHQEILEQIWEEADAEARKLEGLLTGYQESNLREAFISRRGLLNGKTAIIRKNSP